MENYKILKNTPARFYNPLTGPQRELNASVLLFVCDIFDKDVKARRRFDEVWRELSLKLELRHEKLELNDDNNVTKQANYDEMAKNLLKKLCHEDVGWFEDEMDSMDGTFEKYISITLSGLILAEEIQKINSPEMDEYINYMVNIYTILKNKEIWNDTPYVSGLHNIYKETQGLYRALQKLASSIKNIIRHIMTEEQQSYQALVSGYIDFYHSDFLRSFYRLENTQVDNYKSVIISELTKIKNDKNPNNLLSQITADFMRNSSHVSADDQLQNAEEQVKDEIDSIIRFMNEDFEILRTTIKNKIIHYSTIANEMMRLKMSNSVNDKANLEKIIQYYVQNHYSDSTKNNEVPEELENIFKLNSYKTMGVSSIRSGQSKHMMKKSVVIQKTVLTKEEEEEDRKRIEEIVNNPYGEDKCVQYVSKLLGNKKSVSVREIPLEDTKENMLLIIASTLYGNKRNGYDIVKEKGQITKGHIKIDNFTIERRTNDKGNVE